MKVTFARRVGDTAVDRADLTPTTHPKGGDAWDVQMGERNVGRLRRWECNEESMTITPSGGTWRKRRVTRWTAYPTSAEGKGCVYDSRAAALRRLRDDARQEDRDAD